MKGAREWEGDLMGVYIMFSSLRDGDDGGTNI
jgi:hypothetical protein